MLEKEYLQHCVQLFADPQSGRVVIAGIVPFVSWRYFWWGSVSRHFDCNSAAFSTISIGCESVAPARRAAGNFYGRLAVTVSVVAVRAEGMYNVRQSFALVGVVGSKFVIRHPVNGRYVRGLELTVPSDP